MYYFRLLPFYIIIKTYWEALEHFSWHLTKDLKTYSYCTWLIYINCSTVLEGPWHHNNFLQCFLFVTNYSQFRIPNSSKFFSTASSHLVFGFPLLLFLVIFNLSSSCLGTLSMVVLICDLTILVFVLWCNRLSLVGHTVPLFPYLSVLPTGLPLFVLHIFFAVFYVPRLQGLLFLFYSISITCYRTLRLVSVPFCRSSLWCSVK